MFVGVAVIEKKEHSHTPDFLVKELELSEQIFFRTVFSKRKYRKIYRLYELEK